MYIFKYFSNSVIQGGLGTLVDGEYDQIENDFIFLGFSSGALIEAFGGDDTVIALWGNKTINAGLGNDYVYSASGDTVIYGDTGITESITPLPDGVQVPDFFPFPSTTQYGDDVLISGSGNDLIFGDQGTSSTIIRFATSNAQNGDSIISSFTLDEQVTIWGDDFISSGAGDDVIYGDAGMLGLTFLGTDGSTSIADGSAANAYAVTTLGNNLFEFGHDIIYAGSGNDIISGDRNVIAMEPGAGLAIASNGGVAKTFLDDFGSNIYSGSDTIYGGGGQDIIYGYGRFNTHEVFGGIAEAESGGKAETVSIIKDSFNEFLGDYLYGGSGNDIIYGEFLEYKNILEGGSATADGIDSIASSHYEILDTELVYGDSYLAGNNGSDILFGDLRYTELTVNEGVATETNGGESAVFAEIRGFIQDFGDDEIHGGHGKDKIIADALDYKLVDDNLSLSVENIKGVDRVALKDSFDNTILWGNDTISGGQGKDAFYFTLFEDDLGELGMQGFDTILDFSTQEDMLIFSQIDDFQSLKDHAEIEILGSDTHINFDLGGRLTLANVHVSTLDELHIDIISGVPVI